MTSIQRTIIKSYIAFLNCCGVKKEEIDKRLKDFLKIENLTTTKYDEGEIQFFIKECVK